MSQLQPLFGPTYEPYSGYADDRLRSGEETVDRRVVNSSSIGLAASGALRLTYWTARKSETVNQVRIRTGGTAAAATPTLCRIGVYEEAGSGDLALVASIANDTTLFAAGSTVYTRNFSAPWQKRRGTRYAMGLLVVSAAVLPTFYGISGITAGNGLDSAELAATPRLNGNLSSQTDLPSSITTGSVAASGTGMIFVAFTP